jgi:hypothetical protein
MNSKNLDFREKTEEIHQIEWLEPWIRFKIGGR